MNDVVEFLKNHFYPKASITPIYMIQNHKYESKMKIEEKNYSLCVSFKMLELNLIQQESLIKQKWCNVPFKSNSF